MLLEIIVRKNDQWWLSEIVELDLISQGKSRKEALEMILDAVAELYGKTNLNLKIITQADKYFLHSNADSQLIAFILKRLRLRSGLTLQEVAKKLGSNSPNTYARYEQGKANPTLNQLKKLLRSLNSNAEVTLKIAA